MSAAVTGPSMNRGGSRQDYGTPRDFLDAVRRRWGGLAIDLAARADNAKASALITPEQDSLAVPWTWRGNAWLNPPFSNIDPWAAKCARYAEAPMTPDSRILLLVPASVGSNWFAEHVHGRALVLGLQGRLTFEGCDQPYPKDCILAVYGVGLSGFDVWNWRAR